MTLYAIGDIQGCAQAFTTLLSRIPFEPGRDHLWLVGDLVNRGPDSLTVLREIMHLGDNVTTVLGNHDLHLLATAAGVRKPIKGDTFHSVLAAPDAANIVDWLRCRPLLHHDTARRMLLVHAGLPPNWSVAEAVSRAAEVEEVLQGPKFATLLGKMYGNRPRRWSGGLKGYSRLRFIINCLTRMRMMTPDMQLNMRATGAPWRTGDKRVAWFDFEDHAWGDTRIVFGHWSQLGLIVLPNLVSLDTGCVWGRQLTAVRLDRRVARVFQVSGQD